MLQYPLFMNILSLNTWRGKLEKEITVFIQEYKKSVDVFCFQEMSPLMRELCKNLLLEFEEYYFHKFVTSEDDFHQSVFIKKSIAVIDFGSVLDESPNIGFGVWVKIESNGKTLFVCNYHGMSRPGTKLDTPERLAASQELISFFSKKAEPKVIIGDFNLLNSVRSIVMFEENGYLNLIKKYNFTNTRNKYAWEKHPEKIQYYADFAFVSSNISEKGFIVLPDEVSDHAPLLLTL